MNIAELLVFKCKSAGTGGAGNCMTAGNWNDDQTDYGLR